MSLSLVRRHLKTLCLYYQNWSQQYTKEKTFLRCEDSGVS